MKLSEAILLGDSLKKPDSGNWLSPDGSCGCAIGGALLATGYTGQEFHRVLEAVLKASGGMFKGWQEIAELEAIRSRWPWLTGEALCEISHFYIAVEEGRMTIEELADGIRGLEPADDAPAGAIAGSSEQSLSREGTQEEVTTANQS